MNHANLKICARCDQCRTSADGKLVCVLTGKGIEAQANGEGCPKQLFPRTAMGTVPENYDPRDYALDSGGSEGCNCGGE